MSARDVVLCWMTNQAEPGWDEDDPTYQRAVKALDAFAHELAEKQRYEHNEVGGGCDLGVCHGDALPDLIDPVRPDEEPTT
ncbi:hypothetical protein [Streptomyces achromogenes]|uniref:hypothetical protein n=1 Tax=Streptomyces achromogenes TaxID=67255 RepID=UPI003A807AEB